METQKPLLEGLFNKQIRYIIPVFQRHYVWTEEYQWKPLWEDIQNKILDRIKKNKIHPHYTGSIVLNQEIVTTDILSTYCVIDGQQRLTTFQLFLIAFREVCRKLHNDEVLINNINKYIFNDPSYGVTNFDEQKYKLLPTKFDIEIFRDIADLTYDELHEKRIKPIKDEYGFGPKTYMGEAKRRSAIMGAYLYFYDELTKYLLTHQDNSTIDELIKNILLAVTRDFQFVEIGLSPNDDPQMIFETLNGRGASLTETDLIRNYIFMRAAANSEDLNDIYEKYWDEYDDPNSSYKWHDMMKRGRFNESRLQFFLIDYLTVKTKSDIKYDQVFYRYKSYIINSEPFESSEAELRDLYRYSRIFKSITAPSPDSVLGRFSARLICMDITTIFPLLLYVEGCDEISDGDKNKIYSALDSYITRRFICGLTTKNYNNVFLDFIKFLSNRKDADSFIEYVKSKTADSNVWPNNNVLKDKFLNRPIYSEERGKSKAIVNILLEIEQYIRTLKQEKVHISQDNLTIEHVMPQKWFEYWPLNGKAVSEEDFEFSYEKSFTEEDENGFYHQIERRKKIVNTIGNLTLLTSSLNPSVSNDAYSKKKPEIIKESTLKLNAYFHDIQSWDEAKIRERGEVLFSHFVSI